MVLGTVVHKTRQSSSLKNIIEQTWSQERETRPLTLESKIRASSMYRICAREEVLASLLGRVRTERISADLNLVFENGHALHHQFQNSILVRAGVIVGQWQCMRCAKLHGAWSTRPELSLRFRPKECTRCAYTSFVFNELSFEDPVLRITGHPDGFLRIPYVGGLGLLELKTVSQRRAWEIKKVPDVAHVIQAQTYMMLTGLKWARIVYWIKSEFGLASIVEHHIEKDLEVIEYIRSNVAQIWEGIKMQSPPSRTVCTSRTCPRAQECQMATVCFGGEDDRAG